MNSVAVHSSVSQLRAAARPSAPSSRRSTVVVRANVEGESRRAMLAGLVAGLAGLTATRANAIDLFDDRKAKKSGYDLIYEARDLDLPQSVRDGLTQARENLAEAKKRVSESEKRIDSALGEYVDKAYWTLAREELRGQVGTLRFDINALASQLEKTERKNLLALKDEFLASVDDLDFALRKKDKETASKALATVRAKLDTVIASLG